MRRPLSFVLGLSIGIVGAACSGDHIGLGPADVEPEAFPEIEAATARLPRLSQTQYRNAIEDVFGKEITLPSRLEPDVSVDGLIAIGSSQTSISARGVEQYETAAYGIAEQAMQAGEARESLIPCEPSAQVDSSCASESLRALGRRLWRRPLDKVELETLTQISDDAATALGDFHEGLAFGIAAILQSPNFLFRAELGETDPDVPGTLRYTNYEMASRLAFFLWNSLPDEELLTAAQRGDLHDDDKLAAQVDRMLAAPEARHALRNFFSELYSLYNLDDLNKDTTEFVNMNADVGPSAREETLMTIEDHVFDEKEDFRDLFTTNKTFLNRQLAAIYNVPAPQREGFGAFYWPPGNARSGLLTQVSILAGNSHPIDSSATVRGKFVRKILLCFVIIPPPVDVNVALPEPSPGALTLRQRLEAHVVDPSCAGCHQNMDPIGLGLENFDALGQFRTTENGAPIDASGDLDGEIFATPPALGQALAKHPNLPDCLTKNLYRYATNHLETGDERALVEHLQERFALRDYRVLELMRDVVMSPGFRKTSMAEAGE
jgi:hypothetical protein